MFYQTVITTNIIIVLTFVSIINTQHLPLCDSLNEIKNNENNTDHNEIKIRRVRALCDAIYPSRTMSNHNELDLIPDFDLARIDSDNDANEILKRFRRGRGGGGGGGRGGGGGGGRGGGGGGRSGGGSRSSGSRFSSSFSRSSSSSSGSRFFGGSRSSSSSGSSRIFSRSSSGSSSSSGSGSRIFSRSTSSNTGGQHRIRQAVRTMFRHTPSGQTRISSGSGFPGTSGSKPGLSDKFRQITHGGGSGSGFNSRIAGGGFGTGGSGSGGNVWVRTGKKFLPQAVRFGKRYYQRRKYNKGMYAGIGYYGGSHHHPYPGYYYPHENYGYPPVVDTPPEIIEGKTPTVFYCIQEDLNTTLVNQTLNDEGFGTCNVSGILVKCPIEIECKTNEADNCCEDEQGTPYCCGGPIPEEYASIYGGFEDNMYDAAGSFNKILSIITTTSVLLATICFTIWHGRGQ
ncbi:unnamed protein product [Rotaria sp. Silwood1]|nr:unnamed protein product [Rotaria sp. Silwood1]